MGSGRAWGRPVAAACVLLAAVAAVAGCGKPRANPLDRNKRGLQALSGLDTLETRTKLPDLKHPRTPAPAVDRRWHFGPRAAVQEGFALDPSAAPAPPDPSAGPSSAPVRIAGPPRGIDASPEMIFLEESADGRIAVEPPRDRADA